MKKYLEDVAPVLAKVSNYVTRGSDFRLQTRSKYDLRKSLFARRIVTIWNSLPNWNVSDKDLITAPDRTQLAPCVAAGRVLQRLSFFAVFIAFSLTVLVMSYTIFCVVAPGTQRCVLFRRLRSIFRVFARLKFAR